MKDLQKIIDYTTYNDLYISWFKSKTKLVAEQAAIARQCNEIEKAIFEIIDEFNIDNAVGVPQDIIGKWIGRKRDGRNDIDFRKVLKAQIVINTGSGEHEIIIKLCTDIYNATDVYLRYMGNANLLVWANVHMTPNDYAEMLRIVASGVGLELHSGGLTPFGFLGNPKALGYSHFLQPARTVEYGDGVKTLMVNYGVGDKVLRSRVNFNYDSSETGGQYSYKIGGTF